MVVRRRPQRGHRYTESPVLELALQGWRSRTVGLLLMAALLALIIRAFYLQVINNDFLQEKGDSRYRRDIEVSASRGKIVDRHGDMLAVSTPMQSIWAIPADARTMTAEQKRQLAGLLEMGVRELDGKIAADKTFVYVRRQVSPETGARIAALKLPGIHQEKEYRRFYPTADMTAHIVGFTGVDDKGLEGVELAFQQSLLGRPGNRTVIRDRRGNIIEDVGAMRPPQDGKDIRLALDSKIQYLAYSQLKATVDTYKAKAGGVIVVDTRNGEILALVNWPTYNPNNRQNLSGAPLRNRAITDTFEPGSVMKPFIAALALEQGKVTVNTPINTAPGRMTIGSATISDPRPHGLLTVAEVIQKSSNIGTAKIALGFTPKEMWELFDKLGFGQAPNLGFPGEVNGRLRPWKTWRPIEQATMSYGHGIAVSLIQLARAYTVFANDGELMPLSLLSVDETPVHGGRVFSPQTVRESRLMLEMAVQPGGTAPRARVAGYRVGGKTGTAHKIEGGVYAHKYIASFVGIAPISDPRLVIAVMIDEPSTGVHYGGDVAGPAFSRIAAGALRTLGVPLDAPLQMAAVGTGKEPL
ncbi:MAG: penicillin-binding protein 2 [Azonexus sp.]|jgi:cell division protein FtsI (penicillin-binding protein 3)|uniref:peptidoglycan D,D-transpeptidase FtsI family protein n=1 Tax=Azonexus sp. TaxID=1872668 RepID=UPI002825FFDB|nr:penicillin-binding protein 2 [Azonexus sp.]MDR0776012.1 penicillin-binding protein 2 [Azonexus sp.]